MKRNDEPNEVRGRSVGRNRDAEPARRTSLWAAAVVVWLLADVHAEGSPPSADYELTFGDEFVGTVFDTNKWAVMGSPIRQWNPKITVSDGKLNLNLVWLDDINYWSSGQIYSRTFQQRFGYYEASFQIIGDTDEDSDAFSGFSLGQPHDLYGQDVDRLEINLQETHNTYQVKTNLQDWAPEHKSVEEIYPVDRLDLSAGQHIYALEWTTDNRLMFSFDGTVIRELPDEKWTPEKLDKIGSLVPQEILFSTWVQFDPNVYRSKLVGKRMEVDYVRVYDKPGWDGTSDDNWSNVANWGPDGVPGPGVTAMFNRSSEESTVTLSFDTEVRAIHFDTADIPAFTIAGGAGHSLLLGATTTENGVGGITINNSVTQSQTITADINAQQSLMSTAHTLIYPEWPAVP